MKQLLRTICLIVLVCSLMLGLFVLTSFADFTNLQKGSKGDAVKQVQQALIGQGLLSGTADGDFGDMTRVAVSNFQSANGLEATGVVDEKTYELILEKDAERKENIVLKQGDINEDVTAIEDRLIQLGYMFGRADKIFDNKTETAVKSFQQRNGLDVTGKVNKDVQSVLFSEDAVEASRANVVVPDTVNSTVHYSSPYLKVVFRNNSDEIIDAIDFHFIVYNSFGERRSCFDNLYSYKNEEEYSTGQFARDLYPQSTGGLNRREEIYLGSFQAHDNEALTMVKVAVSRYHTKSGNSYEIPENEWIWIDVNGNSEILQSNPALKAGEISQELQDRVRILGLGFEDCGTIKDYIAGIWGLPFGGLYIDSYLSDGILKNAGVEYQDVITTVDNFAIYSKEDLIYALGEGSKDGQLEIIFYHAGVEKKVTIDTSNLVSMDDTTSLNNTLQNTKAGNQNNNYIEETIDYSLIYQNAMYLFIEGNYEEAKTEFEKLGDYEHSYNLIAKCNEHLNNMTSDDNRDSEFPLATLLLKNGNVTFQLKEVQTVEWDSNKETAGMKLIVVRGIVENINYDDVITNYVLQRDGLIVADQDGFSLEYDEYKIDSDGAYEVRARIRTGVKKRISLPFVAPDSTTAIVISYGNSGKLTIPLD